MLNVVNVWLSSREVEIFFFSKFRTMTTTKHGELLSTYPSELSIERIEIYEQKKKSGS
jgi:hypothetical protein